MSEAELFFCEAQNRSFFSQTETKSLTQKLQNHLIDLDIRSSLWMALFDSIFRKNYNIALFSMHTQQIFLSWSFDLQNGHQSFSMKTGS